MPRTEGVWPEDHTVFMTDYLGAGGTASECADALNKQFGTNYTRSAVCGRAARAKISFPRGERTERQRAPRPVPTRPKIVKIRSKPKPFLVDGNGHRSADVIPRLVSLVELEPGDCHWPYGDGPFLFCGHPTLDGDSYCVEHQALAWRPAEQRRAA